MDVIGYASLSDDLEADRDFGFAIQDALIRGSVEERGWNLLEIVRDSGIGDVSTLPDRVGLATALSAARDGRAHAIVVARLDRLAIDLVLQEQILFDARRLGAQVCSATEGESDEIASPNPERALVRRTLASVGAHESALRDLWVRYRVMRSPISGDREQAAMSRIEELSEQGATISDIAGALNEEGFSPHFSRIWNLAGLRRIVERMRARRA